MHPGARLLGLVAVVVLLSGCAEHARLRASVHLRLTAPRDGVTVTARSVTVRGSVRPSDADVLVAGRRVTVRAGRFATAVALAPGTSVIDVLAGAHGEVAAAAAVRVTRQVLVAVPYVAGDSPAQAKATLQAAGLRARERGDANPFRFFLAPFPSQVCGTTPGAGTQVAPNTVITVQLGKLC